jgi:hypothetical protein
MSITLYDITIPPLLRGFRTLNYYIDMAEAYGEAHQFSDAELLNLRLASDMMSFGAQIQRASDSAKAALARLTGVKMPGFADTETTFKQLRQRIAATVELIERADRTVLDASVGSTIELQYGAATLRFSGRDYVLQFMLPNFLFHITTAHGILRQRGLDIGKRDYLGPFQ